MQGLSVPSADEPPADHFSLALDARVERCKMTADGHVLIFGWMADEGLARPSFAIVSKDAVIPWRSAVVLRHRRPDVEAVRGSSQHDFGFLLLAHLGSGIDVAAVQLIGSCGEQACRMILSVQRSSERGLLDELLAFLGFFHALGGREVGLHNFLLQGGRQIIAALNATQQSRAARIQQVERFGAARRGPSFMTVLFGAVEAVMFQPFLFAKAGIIFGEWVYVCNSPEQADDLMRLARSAANLHDLPIRVVVLTDNAGFGAANNAAMSCVSNAHVVLVNPDVHPLSAHVERLNAAVQPDRFADALRGGLLFYDDQMLMHGGMYLDEDVHVASGSFAPTDDEAPRSCKLLRVEHYDKGVPFVDADWAARRQVPAVTGALMAFARSRFEAIGGFSGDFVYGHYEDADLCLRWGDRMGPVEVDPDIRLVHLEGMGSKTRLPHFHGASIVNRHIFDARNRHFAEADRAPAPQDPRGL